MKVKNPRSGAWIEVTEQNLKKVCSMYSDFKANDIKKQFSKERRDKSEKAVLKEVGDLPQEEAVSVEEKSHLYVYNPTNGKKKRVGKDEYAHLKNNNKIDENGVLLQEEDNA